MSIRSRERITSVFLFLIMGLNIAGFIVREYLIITSSNEETRWIAYVFAGAHLAVALCAFLIWRGKPTALYLFLAITFLVIILDVSLTVFDRSHEPSIPDIVLAFSESVILLILLSDRKSERTNL